MKKTVLLLLLVFCILLCSCTSTKESNFGQSAVGDDTNDVSADSDDLKYTEIECRSADQYALETFALQNSNRSVNIELPSDWVIDREDGGCFAITRDGAQIGKIVKGIAQDVDRWKAVDVQGAKIYDLICEKSIERYISDTELNFRYRFTYTYNENGTEYVMTLTVNYAEVDQTTADKLHLRPSLGDISEITQFGCLSDVPNGKILILGNSFINTSRIGNILNEMFQKNGKSCFAQAVSRGYATVKTYAQDSSTLSSIKNGAYDAVFICGLYTGEEINYLTVLYEACQRSDTALVVFPAHNEAHKVAVVAQQKHDGSVLLHWQEEINDLIGNGIDKWQFCINDAHLHSTPLAGYVGAHMIYRAIFGEIPCAKINETISYKQIYSILSDYAYTGISDQSINCLY